MLPILFELPTPWGAIPIYSYGVMLGTSLVVAWYLVMRLGRRELDVEVLGNAFIVATVAALLGARALFIATNADEHLAPGTWFRIQSGGLVAYGGFLGGLAGAFLYVRQKRIPMGVVADLAAPALALGVFLTRIGCWLYGCDFGAPLDDDAPGWLKSLGTFPKWDIDPEGLACSHDVGGSPAWNHHRAVYDLPRDRTSSLPVHPTQLYESVFGLALFGLALWQRRVRRFHGQVLVAVASAYAVGRFILEAFRDDPQRGALLGFSTSQLLSLLVLPACLYTWVYLRRRARAGEEPKVPEAYRPSTAPKAPAR